MTKFINACCITTVAALSVVSCSTSLFSRIGTNKDIATEQVETIIDSISLTPLIDSLDLGVEIIDSLAAPITIDSMELAAIIAEEEEDQIDEIHQHFFFEESQSKGVNLAEFKSMVFEDIALDLRTENSHYPADGHVTSPYGWRRSRMHTGTDLKVQVGDDIYAAFDGVVRLAKYYGAYGNCLVIRHYNGLETLYAHASKLLVGVNDVVKAGDVVALGGNTGRSTGSHLHFEVRINGNHISPTFILDTDNRKIKDTTLYVTMRNGKIFASNNEDSEQREAKILQEISIRYYTVRSGDNLSVIASRNGTTVTTLCRLNGISSRSTLRIGQRLIVRDGIKVATSSSSSTATTSAAKSSSASTSTSSTASAKTNTITYTIKNGDTLGKIAKQHGTTVTSICNLNGIKSTTTLKIGRRLTINSKYANSSSSAASTSSASSGTAQYHYVKSGDTLSEIAQKYGTTVTKLCQLNGISRTSMLRLKQKIRVK